MRDGGGGGPGGGAVGSGCVMRSQEKNAALVARPCSAACESCVVQCSACLAFARTARACRGGGSCAVGSQTCGHHPRNTRGKRDEASGFGCDRHADDIMEIIRACDDRLLAIFTEAQRRAGPLHALMQPLPSRLQLKHLWSAYEIKMLLNLPSIIVGSTIE